MLPGVTGLDSLYLRHTLSLLEEAYERGDNLLLKDIRASCTALVPLRVDLALYYFIETYKVKPNNLYYSYSIVKPHSYSKS